jgi:hypothetical protein
MKRDWKLIRAIVREEETNAWPSVVVLEHKALCSEAGYVRAQVARTFDTLQPVIMQYPGPWQTPEVFEVAEVLANADDLDAVLRMLDERQVGHSADLVFELMARKARVRLG